MTCCWIHAQSNLCARNTPSAKFIANRIAHPWIGIQSNSIRHPFLAIYSIHHSLPIDDSIGDCLTDWWARRVLVTTWGKFTAHGPAVRQLMPFRTLWPLPILVPRLAAIVVFNGWTRCSVDVAIQPPRLVAIDPLHCWAMLSV